MKPKGATTLTLQDISYIVENKTKAEVEEYSKKFWRVYKQLPDWEKYSEPDLFSLCTLSPLVADVSRIIGGIEKGEARIERKKMLRNSLITKIESTANPWCVTT